MAAGWMLMPSGNTPTPAPHRHVVLKLPTQACPAMSLEGFHVGAMPRACGVDADELRDDVDG